MHCWEDACRYACQLNLINSAADQVVTTILTDAAAVGAAALLMLLLHGLRMLTVVTKGLG